jgi:predicted metal-dependent phosphoesterase TrpH
MAIGEKIIMFSADLHVHTKHSGDNNSEPEEVIKIAISKGIKTICFTEHNFYHLSSYVEELREKYKGRIELVRGVEFSSIEGHCLVFGCDPDKLLPLSYHKIILPIHIEVLLEFVEKNDGVAIPSHPYRGDYVSMGDLIRKLPIKVIEGINSKNLSWMNDKAIQVANELKLKWTGGSDSHQPHEVGNGLTAFPILATQENIVKLLKG